jgi:hypothetical protein
MFLANRELHQDAHGYFFANNAFEVYGLDGASCTSFLGRICPDVVSMGEKVSELVKEVVLQSVQNSLHGRGVEVMIAVIGARSTRLKNCDTGEFL